MSEDPGEPVANGFVYDVIPRRPLKWARLTGGLSVLRLILKHRPDACLLCNIEHIPLGFVLKFFTRIKVVFDCRESFYALRDNRQHWPKWFRWPFAYVVRGLEFILDRVYDGLVTSDPSIYKVHEDAAGTEDHLL